MMVRANLAVAFSAMDSSDLDPVAPARWVLDDRNSPAARLAKLSAMRGAAGRAVALRRLRGLTASPGRVKHTRRVCESNGPKQGGANAPAARLCQIGRASCRERV